MKKTFFAASLTAIALTFSTPTFAEDIADPQTNSEAVAENAHDLMDAMMQVFTDAFALVGKLDQQTKDVLMARIDASIADYLTVRSQKAQLEDLMLTLSPSAQDRVAAFYATSEGRELFGALPVNAEITPALTVSNMTHAEHVELMEGIINALMEEANQGSTASDYARELAYAIHKIEKDAADS
ncbi:MAG: hypothetical protein AAF830_05955 [Pseudomonadota bacterium]